MEATEQVRDNEATSEHDDLVDLWIKLMRDMVEFATLSRDFLRERIDGTGSATA